jgi:UDPglucose 6-dehydrogenase
MTVVGARSARVRERLAELLAPFGGELRTFADPTTAETVKIVHNVFNATKISFWNEVWQVCQAIGVDHDEVATTVARSAEGSFNPMYGIRGGAPYGGVCLPKDTNGMLGFARGLGVSMPLLEAVVTINDAMIDHVESEFAQLPAQRYETAAAERGLQQPAEAEPDDRAGTHSPPLVVQLPTPTTNGVAV